MTSVSGYAARNPGWLGPPQVRRRVAVSPRPEASSKVPPLVAEKECDARLPSPAEEFLASLVRSEVISTAVRARAQTLNSSKAPA